MFNCSVVSVADKLGTTSVVVLLVPSSSFIVRCCNAGDPRKLLLVLLTLLLSVRGLAGGEKLFSSGASSSPFPLHIHLVKELMYAVRVIFDDDYMIIE